MFRMKVESRPIWMYWLAQIFGRKIYVNARVFRVWRNKIWIKEE